MVAGVVRPVVGHVMLWIALLVAAFALLSVAQLFQLTNVSSTHAPVGRLIRARARRGDNEIAIYVVAEAAFERAVNILKTAFFSRSYEDYDDLGRVTAALLSALGLQMGQFART
jgi:hypothetical protein